MPALQATRIEPVRTLRGEVVKDARPGRARNVADRPAGRRLRAAADLLGVFLRSASPRRGSIRASAPPTRSSSRSSTNRSARRWCRRSRASRPSRRMAAVRPGMLPGRAPVLPTTGAGRAPRRLQVRLARVLRRARHSDRARAGVHGRGRRRSCRSRSSPKSTARQLWPDGERLGETFALEPDPSSPRTQHARANRRRERAHRHRRRRLARRRWLPVRRHQGSRLFLPTSAARRRRR